MMLCLSIPIASPCVPQSLLLFVCVCAESDHELRGAAGRAGVCAGEGAVPRAEPRHSLRLHRHHRGAAARRLPAMLPFPRPVRQDGRAPLPGESGESKAAYTEQMTLQESGGCLAL